MNGKQIIWELVKDNFEQARSHETMRDRTVSLTMTIAAIVFSSLAIDSLRDSSITVFCCEVTFQVFAGIFLLILGVYGALCSAKHYERNRMHVELGIEYIGKLHEQDSSDFPFDPNDAFTKFKAAKKWKGAKAEPIKLNWLWTGFPLLIAALGAVLLFGGLFG